ncbi:MAG: TetR/AcrR family transcriptional regulator [bacterium]|nr:TetR/AcrR family transcriptional regulator [bacterium]
MAAVPSPVRKRPRRTQAERSALSEDRLMEAALKLIVERGYDRTSLQAIGDEAGYSRGLVSHRFGSKEGLLWAMCERTFAAWRTESLAPRLGDRVGVEALHATLAAMRTAMQQAPGTMRAFYALLFESLGPLDVLRPKVAAFHRRERKQIAGRIAAGVAAGSVRADVDPERAAALFLAMVRGAAYQWLLDPRGVDVASLYDAVAEAVERTLRP